MVAAVCRFIPEDCSEWSWRSTNETPRRATETGAELLCIACTVCVLSCNFSLKRFVVYCLVLSHLLCRSLLPWFGRVRLGVDGTVKETGVKANEQEEGGKDNSEAWRN